MERKVFAEMGLQQNKPDFRELDLGSPISTFTLRRSSDGVGTTATTTTTTTGSSSTNSSKRSNGNGSNQSGELETRRSASVARNSKPSHRRSASVGSPLIYSGYSSSTTSSGCSNCSAGGGGGGGASSVSISSPNTVLYPTGNICPSGKILKSNMGSRTPTRMDTLGSGTANYGHGSIIRGGGGGGKLEICTDPEEVKKGGNELYMKGNFAEALLLYDKAISMSPENASYRSNRAAALTMLGRLGEAVSECEEAVRLDPGFGRAHQRLASLYLRLGQVENARRHLHFNEQQSDKNELQKLLLLEKHINRCADARKMSDWNSALKECEAAIVAGADSSPDIIASKAEAFAKLHQLEKADSILSSFVNLDPYPTSCLQTKLFGMLPKTYLLYVRALVDMAFGRFDNAVAAAEKASKMEQNNVEVALLLNNVKLVKRARSRGKELFDSGRFEEACAAYGDGLEYDMSNSVLYCNRAICWSKLGQWGQSVEDCNQALKILPNYTKALLRRAVSNEKLKRWAEAVRDYENLRRELPWDSEVAECLLRAQAALKKLEPEGVHTRVS